MSERLSAERWARVEVLFTEAAHAVTAYADWLVAAGRGAKALPLAMQALETRLGALDDDALAVALSRSTLGAALMATGSLSEAEQALVRAGEVIAERTPPNDPQRLRSDARLEALRRTSSR